MSSYLLGFHLRSYSLCYYWMCSKVITTGDQPQAPMGHHFAAQWSSLPGTWGSRPQPHHSSSKGTSSSSSSNDPLSI
jgi:hypothetical protein